MDGECECIRCREVGLSEEEFSGKSSLNVMEYKACDGVEKFISIDDPETDQLIGFARLRIPDSPHREELMESSILRELHVYGNQVPINQSDNKEPQHQGYGKRLMEEAEKITIEEGRDKISVISGIGVREYYIDKLGYEHDGPYVSKEL